MGPADRGWGQADRGDGARLTAAMGSADRGDGARLTAAMGLAAAAGAGLTAAGSRLL